MIKFPPKTRPNAHTTQQSAISESLNRKRKLNPKSSKRKKEEKIYLKEAKLFLLINPVCQCAVWGCQHPSEQVHHKAKRGKHFLNINTWMAVCAMHHRFIHDNPAEAKKIGYLLDSWKDYD
jgi:hypothetical protein